MKSPDPNEEREDGWTIDEILRERGYPEQTIAEMRQRREAKVSAQAI